MKGLLCFMLSLFDLMFALLNALGSCVLGTFDTFLGSMFGLLRPLLVAML